MTTKLLFTWNPPRGIERIRERVEDIDVVVAGDPASALKQIGEAEIVCVGHWTAELFQAAKRLRWVHAFSGGVNGLLFRQFVSSPIPMTCLKGTFDIPAAEYALGVMLAFTRRIESDVRERASRTFTEREPMELSGKTVGIVGFGNMGREIARRCQCFGMNVIGLSRQPIQDDPRMESVRWLAPQALPELLAASDFIVVALPLTDETAGRIGPAELACIKPSAYLIDVSGRPAIYDLDALRSALASKRIAGASLQLIPPPDSPLWDLKELLLSFHRIGSQEHFDRCIDAFSDNLRLYQAGKPLRGLVDKKAGY